MDGETSSVPADIAATRRRAGLTQSELARRTGLSQPNISAYETGRRRPNAATLATIRRALGPRPSELLAEHRTEIAALVAAHRGSRAWVFGSAATADDRAGSDLDLLVEFAPGASLIDLSALTLELEGLLGIPVDIVSAGGLRGAIGDSIRDTAIPLVTEAAA